MWRFLLILVMILLTSCDQPDKEPLLAKESSLLSSNLQSKAGILLKQKIQQPQPVGASAYSFVMVNEWFDHETILYLTDENGASFIYKFHIFTGEEEIFFKIEEPIMRLDANVDYSMFVIEVGTISGHKDLYFVNKHGETVYHYKNIGDEYELYWNPFKNFEVTIAILQEDFSMKLKLIDLRKKTVKDFEFDYYYIQWLKEQQFAYLKWDMYSPSYYAPLYTYNIKTLEEEKLADEIIAFFGFTHAFLTISVAEKDVLKANYRFYDAKTKKFLSSLEVPILNTYSQTWWIPSHDFVNSTFYFLQPRESGDLYDYQEGFTLAAFQVETGKIKELTSVDLNYPLKVSPDGKWALMGFRLENIIDLSTKVVKSLVY